MVVVLPDHRPSGNLPSGQRSGDSARADEPIVYCHERQRETLRLRKYPSGRTAGHVLLFQDLVGTMGGYGEQRRKGQRRWILATQRTGRTGECEEAILKQGVILKQRMDLVK